MRCLICNGEVNELLDFGFQPVCSHFIKGDFAEVQSEFTLELGVCDKCGLVQLIPPFVPINELKVKNPRYSEPEEHLDDLAKEIFKASGKGALAVGASFKDKTLLQRLQKLGFSKLSEDQCLPDGVEKVQKLITEKKYSYEGVDVVIARHILEHCQKPRKFLESLKTWIVPEGRIIIEVPDCSDAIKLKDYTTVWEEHVTYFTPKTLRSTLETVGLHIISLSIIPYPLENSLVAICRLEKENQLIAEEKNLAKVFGEEFTATQEKIKKALGAYKKKDVAILGAGHLSCTFINLFELEDNISVVIDDDPAKKGLLMPGSELPIKDSGALKGKKLCLLGVNPRNEEKVIQKHKDFKGKFVSIFPSSKRHL